MLLVRILYQEVVFFVEGKEGRLTLQEVCGLSVSMKAVDFKAYCMVKWQ